MALTCALMDSDISLAVADSPGASRVVLHIKAAVAEDESVRQSERVRAALAEAKKRGVRLGRARPIEDMRAMSLLGRRVWSERAKARSMEIAPLVWKMRAGGKTLAEIASELNWQNVPTPQGRRWHSPAVLRLLRRTESDFAALADAVAARPSHRAVRARERAERVAPLVWQIRLTGKSLPEVAEELNRLGVATPRGRRWCKEKVRNVLSRARAVLAPEYEAAAAAIIERRRALSISWAIRAAPFVCPLKRNGVSLRKIAAELQRRNVATARGGRWHADEVKTVLELTASAVSATADPVAA
jgi:hypothetical protein